MKISVRDLGVEISYSVGRNEIKDQQHCVPMTDSAAK